jgi:hypothetical protein
MLCKGKIFGNNFKRGQISFDPSESLHVLTSQENLVFIANNFHFHRQVTFRSRPSFSFLIFSWFLLLLLLLLLLPYSPTLLSPSLSLSFSLSLSLSLSLSFSLILCFCPICLAFYRTIHIDYGRYIYSMLSIPLGRVERERRKRRGRPVNRRPQRKERLAHHPSLWR